MGTNQTTNISKKLDIKEGNQTPTDYIESLPTFNKLCLAQSLLKEMYSLKGRFEENKTKMIGELDQNSFKYYKNKLNSKEIYDYFESNNLDERYNYKIINNSKIFNIYKHIYDFLFLLRNDNSLIIEIINKCEPKYYKDLSYFLVHFFYEDTTNYLFFQEELLLFIYLFLENKIIKSLPEKLNSSLIKKDNELYTNQSSNNFAYHLFYSLTKKPDIRNYLCSCLSDIIKKLEENQYYLSTEIIIISKELGLNAEDDSEKEGKNVEKKSYKGKENEDIIFLKDNKKFKQAIKLSNVDFKRKSVTFFETNEKVKIDQFFNAEDIEYMYIIDKLNNYENIKEKSKKDYAMIEYLDILLNEITKDGEPVEIYSTVILKNELKLLKIKENDNNYEIIVNKLKANYDEVTSLITNLLIKIKENLNLVPFSIKCIFKIIDELFNKKYQNIKKELFNYQLLITKARILFGSMIIPMITTPEGSGIFTDGIISKMTKNNLNIISKILKASISGNLFLVESAGYTIYNKFIIDSLPNIFDIILEIDEDITLPNYINELIKDVPENIDNDNRKINYDYFDEKKEEKIQFQSICFSWKDLSILLNTVFEHKISFKQKCKELELEIYNGIIFDAENDLKKYLKNVEENTNKKIIEYYSTYKIFYQKDFENRINAIIKDNFEILFKDQTNNEALRFKRCLTEILAEVNYLHKEDFIYLIERKENQILNKNSIINEYIKYKRKTIYEGIIFDSKKKNLQNVKNQNDLVKLRQNLKKIENNPYPIPNLEIGNFFLKRRSSIYTGFEQIKINESLDFKNDIFPRIASKAMSEIYYNPEKGNSQRIIFCISYILDHFDDLPLKYTQNNYKQIFLDILKEPEILIKELQYNILNKFHSKIRNSEKLNLISSKDYFQIKNMERYSYTGHLFNKVILKGNLKKNIVNKKIDSIHLELNKNNQNIQNNIDTIQSFIEEIPNFKKFENNKENILDLEKKLKINELINNYFKEMGNIVKNEKMIKGLSIEECLVIIYELENYVLLKLYDKLYPSIDTPEDQFFYKKCCRLNFVKPENIIKNKKMINEKLLEISINYISEISRKKTPVDKIKSFGKAIDILKNSMTFNSGKTDLGLDDTLPFIIYIILKSKQKNIYTNFNYCNLFINPELSKKQFGNMLTQLGMVMDIIKNMKYNELIDVTEEQFGKD